MMREFFRGTAVAKKPKGYAVGIRAGRYGFLGGKECVLGYALTVQCFTVAGISNLDMKTSQILPVKAR
jgi:hypothetical protein